ncbi:MAG: hypothetical protein CM1200mP10_06930 [Candidatus Neomarinimicrobiota bacterium]|nr:MAG: hypothetical protein CM1200mP10_06930 [Candidatus Neomarinimicrobiota bacterium]
MFNAGKLTKTMLLGCISDKFSPFGKWDPPICALPKFWEIWPKTILIRNIQKLVTINERFIKIIGIVFIIFMVLLSIPISFLDKKMGGAYGTVNQNDFIDNYFGNITASANLSRAYPPMPIRAKNPVSVDKEKLGRLLFFDPILSGDNTISCAHCHHPDLGFTDNRALSMGQGALV